MTRPVTDVACKLIQLLPVSLLVFRRFHKMPIP
jgi:hypothetical protein